MNYDHITRDIGRKLCEDVGSACRRNMAIVSGLDQSFMVAMFGASTAIACAATSFAALNPDLSADDVAKVIWEMMEPIVSKNIADITR